MSAGLVAFSAEDTRELCVFQLSERINMQTVVVKPSPATHANLRLLKAGGTI